MTVVWTRQAVNDLSSITSYIGLGSSAAADRVAHKIAASVEALAATPAMGRTGEVPGTRELVITPWPYIVVYGIRGEHVRVLRIRHGAQVWP